MCTFLPHSDSLRLFSFLKAEWPKVCLARNTSSRELVSRLARLHPRVGTEVTVVVGTEEAGLEVMMEATVLETVEDGEE